MLREQKFLLFGLDLGVSHWFHGKSLATLRGKAMIQVLGVFKEVPVLRFA